MTDLYKQNFLVKFHTKRAKAGIKSRVIFGDNLSEMTNKINDLPRSKVKMFPSKENLPVAILVYKDKTLFSLPEDYLLQRHLRKSSIRQGGRCRFS